MKKSVIRYYGAYEGLQEQIYFSHLQKLINNCEKAKYRVSFTFNYAGGGSPLYICEKAYNSINFEDKKRVSKENRIVSIFDYDFKDGEFKKALKYCEDKSICKGYSNVCFDLWLILHKVDFNKQISFNYEYESKLKEVYKISSEKNIKKEKVIKEIIEQITIDEIKEAIERCKKMEKNKSNNQILFKEFPNDYSQPYIKLYKFIERVFGDVEI